MENKDFGDFVWKLLEKLDCKLCLYFFAYSHINTKVMYVFKILCKNMPRRAFKKKSLLKTKIFSDKKNLEKVHMKVYFLF